MKPYFELFIAVEVLFSHLLLANDPVPLDLSPEAKQEKIDMLLEFCQMVCLDINVHKTKFITFNPHRSKASIKRFLDKEDLYFRLQG